jgi:hypothetical protein
MKTKSPLFPFSSTRSISHFFKLFGLSLFLSFFISLNTSSNTKGDHIKLVPNHPDLYTVVKGDTLWDISGKFLQFPWQWPEIWEVNPQIKNPHWIYPGDQLAFSYIDGQPRIRRIGNGQRPTFKLSPTKRIEQLNLAIPTIQLEKIAPFLTGNRILSKRTLDRAPYVVGTSEEHLIAAAGHEVYVQNLPMDNNDFRFGFYYPGKRYVDPHNSRITLGYEGIYLGKGELIRKGQPATLAITQSKAEIINGARVIALNKEEFNSNFMPKAAQTKKVGRIVGSLNSGIQAGVNNVAASDVVLVSFGKRDKIEVGDVLNIYRKGDVIQDPVAKTKKIRLPNEFAGNMLIFKVFKKISYALVMDANQVIKIGDLAVSPYMIQK